MMYVETQEDAEYLNENGHTPPYHAFNGHTMIAPIRMPLADEPDPDPNMPYFMQPRRAYRVGDRVDSTSYNAWCAEGCLACAEGDPLPDW